MTAYDDIKTSRRLMWAGIVLGYALAVTVAVFNLTSDDGSILTALAFLAMLSIPSTMALLSLDRRPSLRTTAAMSALFPAFLLLGAGFGLVYVVVAILWYLAGQKRPRPAASPEWAFWARPLLAAAIVLPMFALTVHRDPQCTVTAADGTVTVTEETPYPTGWSFGLTTTTGTTSSTGTETKSCVSDMTVWWEASLSILLSAGIITLAWQWPTASALEGPDHPDPQEVEEDVPRIRG
jgi:hypothetical protein